MLGDFNAYAMEDPIRARKAAGFSEVVEEYDPDAASSEFSGRVGSLDHIFANAKRMSWFLAPVSGIPTGLSRWPCSTRVATTSWPIYTTSQFGASGHSPALVGFSMQTPAPSPVSTASSTPAVTLVVGSVGPSTAVVAPTSGQGSAFQPRLPRTGV